MKWITHKALHVTQKVRITQCLLAGDSMKKTTVVGTTKNYGATKMNAGKMNILEMDGGDR